jgi:hypothetical protein
MVFSRRFCVILEPFPRLSLFLLGAFSRLPGSCLGLFLVFSGPFSKLFLVLCATFSSILLVFSGSFLRRSKACAMAFGVNAPVHISWILPVRESRKNGEHGRCYRWHPGKPSFPIIKLREAIAISGRADLLTFHLLTMLSSRRADGCTNNASVLLQVFLHLLCVSHRRTSTWDEKDLG